MPAPRTEDEQAAIVAFLSDPATHGGAEPDIVETHAARVFLVGEDAYKLKRAVRFPFLDFTSPEARERVCRREIELNRRTAPELYLDCLAITEDEGDRLSIGGEGTPVDWVVHMRRFDSSATLDRVCESSGLSDRVVDALADEIVAMHADAEVASVADPAGRVREVAESNLADIEAEPEVFPPDLAARLVNGTREALEAHAGLIERRAVAGEVRRCHGDLHLRNVALIEGRPVIFDALEFDDDLATTDVLYDLAFLLMDCWERGARAAANRILNRWIARRRHPADLDGLALLPLFLSMRAAVRAKVATAKAKGETGDEAEAARTEARTYLQTAVEAIAPAPATLVAVGGFSGSGKSTVAQRLAPGIPPMPGAVLLRSDQIRKELAGVAEEERLPGDSYTQESSDRVYEEMRARAGRVLAAGHSAIADAVHGQPGEREAIAAVAHGAGAPFAAVWLSADPAVLSARVRGRRGDASDATAGVVAQQIETLEEPRDWARVEAETTPEAACEAAEAAVRRQIPRG